MLLNSIGDLSDDDRLSLSAFLWMLEGQSGKEYIDLLPAVFIKSFDPRRECDSLCTFPSNIIGRDHNDEVA